MATLATGVGMKVRELRDRADEEAIFPGAVVIGAGAAGLAVAYELIGAGVPTTILEKENRLAEPWQRHDQSHLNSHRDLPTLPGVDYPAGTPAFPHKET